MGRRIRPLPGVDRAGLDGKPVGLQRPGDDHFDRRLFVVRLFHSTESGLKPRERRYKLMFDADADRPRLRYADHFGAISYGRYPGAQYHPVPPPITGVKPSRHDGFVAYR